MTEKQQLLVDRIDTAIGKMILVADLDGNLRALDWVDHEMRMQRLLQRHYGKNGFVLETAENPSGLSDTLRRYFAGDIAAIDSIPVATAGTGFQREVWRACGIYQPDQLGRTQSLRGKLAAQKQFEQSAWLTVQIRLG